MNEARPKFALIEDDAAAWQVGITRETIQRIMAYDSSSFKTSGGDMIALWMFYAYTARWQKVNQPRATTKFVAKGLGFKIDRVLRAKRGLRDLGLIADTNSRDAKGKVSGWYIKVFHLARISESHPLVFPGGGKTKGKCSRSVRLNAQGREGEDLREDGCLAPARSCPEPEANNVVPLKRTNQQPESIKEVVQFALSQAGYAGAEADEFLNAVDFSLDSATLLAGLPDSFQEPFSRAFRFTRLNNGKDWPTHSWRQAYRGWVGQLRDDEVCDVPGWWVATVGDNNVTAEAVF